MKSTTNTTHAKLGNAIIGLALVLAFMFPAWGPQLRAQDITPVDIDVEKPEQPRLHYYDKHGNKLQEPVLFLTETDTVKNPSPASTWPLFNGVTVGVNFFDAVMLIAKQGYASFDASVAVSLHNWFFPTVEAGMGFSDYHIVDTQMVYKTKLSPYIKLGIDYNFLYKSSPDYMAGLGLRIGYSQPKYDITGASVSADYWGESSQFSIYNQIAHAWFGEALASLRVKLWRDLSMGWSVRYRFNIKTFNGSESAPWFIPGYGASAPITATFSLFYTFGRRDTKKEPEMNP